MSAIATSVILSVGVVRETDGSVVEGPRVLYSLQRRFKEFYPHHSELVGTHLRVHLSTRRQGVLGLHDGFALRSSPFAQDDPEAKARLTSAFSNCVTTPPCSLR